MPKRNGPRSCGPCGCPADPGTGITIGIPGCLCTTTPRDITVTVTYGPGETAATYNGQFIDSALRYYTFVGDDKPSYAAYYSGGLGPAYYSIEPWQPPDYPHVFYQLGCFGSQFSLGLGVYTPDVFSQSPGLIFYWVVGGKAPVNFCNPFGLFVGQNSGSPANLDFYAS